MSRDLHVVFGAGGGAGNALVRILAAAGRNVRAVTRGRTAAVPAGVEVVRGDALDADSARTAAAGAAVVYHCVNVPYPEWEQKLPIVMDNIIAAATGRRLVFCDNLYMYGAVAAPITELLPLAATSRKGLLRIRLANTLLKAHAAGRVEAIIGRASDFFGPDAPNTIAGQLVFPAARAQRTAYWLGSLDAPHSMHFLDDVGRALLVLGEHPAAAGAVWHIPAAPPMTGREFIEAAFRIAGTKPRIGVHTRRKVRAAAVFSRKLREILEVVEQFDRPFVIDGSRFERELGTLPITPMDDAIRASLR